MLLRNYEKKDTERKTYNPEELYKLDEEYKTLLSLYLQRKNELKEATKEERKIIAKAASIAQDNLYQFIIKNDYDISLYRIEKLEDRFKKVLETLSALFPSEEKGKKQTEEKQFHILEKNIANYNSAKERDSHFKLFTYSKLIRPALSNAIDPIKPLIEEIHNLYQEIYSLAFFQEKRPGLDNLAPVIKIIMQRIHIKHPDLGVPNNAIINLIMVPLIEKILIEDYSTNLAHKENEYFRGTAFYCTTLLSLWEQVHLPDVKIKEEAEKSKIDKLGLDLALLTRQQTEEHTWSEQLTKPFSIENVISIITSQKSAFDHKNDYFVLYQNILQARSIEETIYKMIALGQTIRKNQLDNKQLTDEDFKKYLQKINFGALNLLELKNVAFIKAIQEALENLAAVTESDPVKKAQFTALKTGFEFFNASAQLDKQFKLGSLPPQTLSTHASLNTPLSGRQEKVEDKKQISEKKPSIKKIIHNPHQTKRAEAYIKRNLSFSPARRKMNNWYHRRTPFEKFLICSSLFVLTIAAIVTVAATGVGAPIGAIIAAGAAKVAVASFGVSAITASAIGAATEIAVAAASIGIVVGNAIALGFTMDKALNPLSPGKISRIPAKNPSEMPPKTLVTKPKEETIQKISVNQDEYKEFKSWRQPLPPHFEEKVTDIGNNKIDHLKNTNLDKKESPSTLDPVLNEDFIDDNVIASGDVDETQNLLLNEEQTQTPSSCLEDSCTAIPAKSAGTASFYI